MKRRSTDYAGGFRERAWAFWLRHKVVICFVVLACSNAVALGVAIHNGQKADMATRDFATLQTKQAADQAARDTASNYERIIEAVKQNRGACRSGNAFRATIRTIVRKSIAETHQLVADGTLTPAQAQRSFESIADTLKRLHGRDCVKAYPLPRHP